MVDRKVQTSFRLTDEEDSRYKALAEERGIPFNQLVRECLAAAYTNPNFLNPIKPASEVEEAIQKVLELNQQAREEQEPFFEELRTRIDTMDEKINSLMSRFKIEQPVKDKSGRRIFDD